MSSAAESGVVRRSRGTAIAVKVCGVTQEHDAVGCADLGVDAIGLNLWPGSRRYVTRTEAERLVSALRSRGLATLVVGVFVDAPLADVVAARDALGLDLVQLHGDEPPELLDRLLPAAFKALRLDGEQAVERARRYGGPHLLLDAAVPGVAGGSGRHADWGLAARIAATRPVWLAGGLRPGDVDAALAAVPAHGLDVASGVELAGATRGEKDLSLVRALLERVRRAG